jgi:hypothetical protein
MAVRRWCVYCPWDINGAIPVFSVVADVMKLMLCNICHDMVKPPDQTGIGRSCECGRHVIWYTTDFALPKFRRRAAILDREGTRDNAEVVRIHNMALLGRGVTSRETFENILEVEPHPRFVAQNSVLLKDSVESSPDVSWATEPPSTFSERLLVDPVPTLEAP